MEKILEKSDRNQEIRRAVSATRALRLRLPRRDHEPLAVEVLEAGEVAAAQNIREEDWHQTAIYALQNLAPEIAVRPDVFADRVMLVSLFDVGRNGDTGRQDVAIVARISERLLARLRRLAGPQDLLLEISAGFLLVISAERAPERYWRWAIECEQVARALLGEGAGESINVHRLESGAPDRLDFAPPAAPQAAAPKPKLVRATREARAARPKSPRWSVLEYDRPPPPSNPVVSGTTELPEFYVHFPPVWDVQNELVTMFAVEPYRMVDNRIVRGLPVVPEAINNDRLMLQFALAVLEQVVERAQQFADNDQPGFLTAPIHFNAVAAGSQRERVVEFLRETDPEIGKRICVELMGVPKGVSSSTLQTVLDALRPCGRALFLRADFHDPRWTSKVNVQVNSIGMAVVDEPRYEAENIRQIQEFAAACRTRQVNPYVLGLNSTSLTLFAAAAGVRYILGDRIGAPFAEAAGAYPFRWLDFYSQSMYLASDAG